MITLAFETASALATIALVEDDQVLGETSLRNTTDLSVRLMVEVDHLLRESGKATGDLALVAVGRGPGGFTSLRVGVATAKAVAHAASRPIVGVSTLDAAAFPLRWRVSALICPVFRAAREDLFAAIYRAVDGECRPLMGERMLTGPALVAELNRHEGDVIFTGGAVDLPREWLTEGLQAAAAFISAPDCYPRAASVAQLGRATFLARGGDDPLSLVPTYLRASAAEMAERATSGD